MQGRSEFEVRFYIHGPEELGDQGFVEDLLHGDFIPLAPCNCNSGIQIIYLGSTQCYRLEVILDPGINLSLLYDRFFGINACLDPEPKNKSHQCQATYFNSDQVFASIQSL